MDERGLAVPNPLFFWKSNPSLPRPRCFLLLCLFQKLMRKQTQRSRVKTQAVRGIWLVEMWLSLTSKDAMISVSPHCSLTLSGPFRSSCVFGIRSGNREGFIPWKTKLWDWNDCSSKAMKRCIWHFQMIFLGGEQVHKTFKHYYRKFSTRKWWYLAQSNQLHRACQLQIPFLGYFEVPLLLKL